MLDVDNILNQLSGVNLDTVKNPKLKELIVESRETIKKKFNFEINKTIKSCQSNLKTHLKRLRELRRAEKIEVGNVRRCQKLVDQISLNDPTAIIEYMDPTSLQNIANILGTTPSNLKSCLEKKTC